MNGGTVASMVALVIAAALLGPVNADAGGVRGGASSHSFRGGGSHFHGGHHGGGHGANHFRGFKHDGRHHGFTHHGHGGHFKGHQAFGHLPLHPGGRILVWVPGGWYWTGWSWVWVAGHWR